MTLKEIAMAERIHARELTRPSDDNSPYIKAALFTGGILFVVGLLTQKR